MTQDLSDVSNNSSNAPAVHAIYSYRALRADGREEFGQLHAQSESLARAAIVDRGWFLVSMQQGNSERARNFLRRFERQPSMLELSIVFRSLATFLDAELTILRALQTLEEIAPPSIAARLPETIDLVKEGNTLSKAMTSSGWRLPAIVTALIQAGEAGGRLAPAVERVAQFIERETAIRSALIAALTYPAILFLVGMTSISILIAIVIPRFAALFADLDRTLPASTQFVLALSTNVRAAIIPGIVVLTIIALMFRSWIRDANGLQSWHQILGQLPIVGNIRGSAATSRLCNALADLLTSGVPVALALDYSAATCGDAAMRARVMRAKTKLVQGGSLSGTIRAENALSQLAIGLIKTGEETGRLAAMLIYAGRIEGDRAEQSAKSAARLIEPTLILIFGAVIAFVAAAILQAVYGIRATP